MTGNFLIQSMYLFKESDGLVGMSERKKLLTLTVVLMMIAISSLFCGSSSVSIIERPQHLPALAEASGTNYTVNITGEVIGTDFFLVTADFIANVTNNRTGHTFQSDQFGHGRFTVTLRIPLDAVDNDSLTVTVLSPDEKTVYGTSYLKLNDTSPGKEYPVSVLVVSPPPNYSGILLVVLVIIFALILAAYIFFVRWYISRIIMRRAAEIMIEKEKKGGGGGGDDVGGV